MGRCRKTTEQDVLARARALFWQHGYGGVSTRQIEAETGLTRFTLQTVYKGKMGLYLLVLDTYLEMIETRFLTSNAADGLPSLIDWFSRRSDPSRMPEVARFGCLMMNAVIEFHGEEPEINKRTQRYFQMVTAFLRGHLEGHVHQAEAKAEVLAAATLGLNAVIRSSGDMDAGRVVSASIVAMIEDWGAA
jgi:TetR/AcrR family transcriptional repressor of nem operon